MMKSFVCSFGVCIEQAPSVFSRIVLNPICVSRFSSRFSYRIIPLLVRWTSFQNPQKRAPRPLLLSHLRRASDKHPNYAARKTRRAALLEVAGSTPPIPRPGGHQNATGLVITPTNHPGRWHITPAAYGAQWKPLAALLA